MKNFDAQLVAGRYLNGVLLGNDQEEWVWYHCYEYFKASRYRQLTATDYNMLSLHLSVYLAQANMYHGSSFILQNGYKIHREVIRLICSPRYHVLSGITCERLVQAENCRLLFELRAAITAIYADIRQKTYSRLQKKALESEVSQQLITKVLLGTLGCVPAFDRRATSVFKVFQIGPQQFSPEAIHSLAAFYRREEKDFSRLAEIIDERQINLPQMKLIDIILQKTAEKSQVE